MVGATLTIIAVVAAFLLGSYHGRTSMARQNANGRNRMRQFGIPVSTPNPDTAPRMARAKFTR